MDEDEAFAGIAYCAMLADGVLASEEDVQIEDLLPQVPLFRAHGDLRDLLVRIEADCDDEAEHLARCAAALPRRLAGTAFLVAAGPDEVGPAVAGEGDAGAGHEAELETGLLGEQRGEAVVDPRRAQAAGLLQRLTEQAGMGHI